MNNATCVLFDTVHGCRTTLVRGTRAEVEEYARRYVLWNATWVPVRGAMPELVQLHEDVSVRIQDEGTSRFSGRTRRRASFWALERRAK